MSLRKDILYLGDMRDATADAIAFIQGRSYDDFLTDKMLQAALERKVEIIGEASKKVSASFRDEHPDWPWDEMRGARNRLIHEYRYVALQRIWKTVIRDLPELLAGLQGALPTIQEPRMVPPAKSPARDEDRDQGR